MIRRVSSWIFHITIIISPSKSSYHYSDSIQNTFLNLQVSEPHHSASVNSSSLHTIHPNCIFFVVFSFVPFHLITYCSLSFQPLFISKLLYKLYWYIIFYDFYSNPSSLCLYILVFSVFLFFQFLSADSIHCIFLTFIHHTVIMFWLFFPSSYPTNPFSIVNTPLTLCLSPQLVALIVGSQFGCDCWRLGNPYT